MDPFAVEKNPEQVQQSITQADASLQEVSVKLPTDSTPQPVVQKSKSAGPDAIQPKSFVSTKEAEIDKSIQMAEASQSDPDEQPEVQEKLEKQITGSDGMWESSAQMEHITGKLVNPKDYRPKSVIMKEKIDQMKAMKA